MNFDSYKNTMTYPQKVDFVSFRVVLKNSLEEVNSNLTAQAAAEIVKSGHKISILTGQALRSDENQSGDVIGEYMVVASYDKDAYKQAIKDYGEETARLNKKFEDDLAEMHGIDPNSKLHSVIYSKAYEDGHSSGYHEVAVHYDELACFAEEIRDAYNEQ